MNLIFERLFELLREWIAYLLPFVICGDDQCGVIRRLGIYRRNLRPGLNWKWPIIESTLVECSALDSTMLREQSLTTADGKQVTLRGVIAYRVVDPKKYILDCATAVSVLNDVGCCVIAERIPQLKSRDILREQITPDLLRHMRQRARKWGIYVESVGLVDRVETSTYRLINSTSHGNADGLPGS